MGGKGRRRREKNYLAAHGGNTRLPPPPNAKELEAFPYKLRKIMELKNSVTMKGRSMEIGKEKKEDSSKEKKPKLKAARSSEIKNKQSGDIEDTLKGNHVRDKSASAESSLADANKRKRKRKSLKDRRFQELDQLATRSKRKERKKEHLKERKMKLKKAKADNNQDFPGKENIRFGEVVEAPPKLSFPKVSKPSIDASQERLRLQAVESYRKRRGWDSRPGIKLPSLAETLI